ncbi:MAG: hypothetical protein AAF738_03695, partial [Bacteroidota bacterium]
HHRQRTLRGRCAGHSWHDASSATPICLPQGTLRSKALDQVKWSRQVSTIEIAPILSSAFRILSPFGAPRTTYCLGITPSKQWREGIDVPQPRHPSKGTLRSTPLTRAARLWRWLTIACKQGAGRPLLQPF